MSGCIELVEEIDESFDAIICPVGTGGTLAGLAAGLGESQRSERVWRPRPARTPPAPPPC
ncbi:pyridoxal-phosphate dependent enzyme [Pseudonocardia eucalypti]|uniref:pyridoxal-phosphate dependent enzyme n=1 Tax=Pseudonocardia eucalypti TaxID=648755 RepID=UPI0031E5C1BC